MRVVEWPPEISCHEKSAVAPEKAAGREKGSLRSTWTISTPLEVQASAEWEDWLRVMPRAFQPGSWEKRDATEPSCWPAMPITTRSLLMAKKRLLNVWKMGTVASIVNSRKRETTSFIYILILTIKLTVTLDTPTLSHQIIRLHHKFSTCL